MIPNSCFLLISGIPATGKSRFGRYLSGTHSFVYYDLEHYAQGWPHPELKSIWDRSRSEFVRVLRDLHPRVVLDWGFPVSFISWVQELLNEGVRPIWFDGNIARAREILIKRCGIDVRAFDDQVRSINKANLPALLHFDVVEALSDSGVLKKPSVILEEIFGK
jgi:hypothetical protein